MVRTGRILATLIGLSLMVGLASAAEFPNEPNFNESIDTGPMSIDEDGDVFIGDINGVTEYDSNGSQGWSSSFSTTMDDVIYEDGIVYAGNNDQVVALNSTDGTQIWSNSNVAAPFDVKDGYTYAMNGDSLVEIDSGGLSVWSTSTYWASNTGFVEDLSVGNNSIYTMGSEYEPVTIEQYDLSNGAVVTNSQFQWLGHMIAADSQDNLYVARRDSNSNQGVVKVDSSFTESWSNNTLASEYVTGMAVDGNDQLYVTGYSQPMRKVGTGGNELAVFGESNGEEPRGIGISPVVNGEQYVGVSKFLSNQNTFTWKNTLSSTSGTDDGGTSSPSETIDNYVPGQTAEFTLSTNYTGYPDQKYDDGTFTEFYRKSLVYQGNNDSGTILQESSWNQIDFPNKNGSTQTEVNADEQFSVQRYQGGNYTAVLSLAKVNGTYDFGTDSWNKTEEEVDRHSYSWTVSEADSPVGPLTALQNFFSSILESIIGIFDQDFEDITIGTPSVEDPPSGPSQ